MNEKNKSTLERFRKLLNLRNYSNRTIEMYIHYTSRFLSSINKSGLHVNSSDLIIYIENYKYSSTSQQNQIYSALKLYAELVLNIKNINVVFYKRPKRERTLPQVIDKDFILDKISKIDNIKHKSIISLAFSVGLRVSEVINLKIEDIDSKRMIINIRQAKGKKDRITPLSENILKLLREYYKQYKPKEYLFNGQFSLG